MILKMCNSFEDIVYKVVRRMSMIENFSFYYEPV